MGGRCRRPSSGPRSGGDVLGILPTGTGKSVCYQLPALSRFHKTGALTVVISPLVALMADQVEGMRRHGITSAVTINGLLSLPERQDALDQVRLGDAAILLISPEQLRNPPSARSSGSARSATGFSTRRTASRSGARISGPTTATSAVSSRSSAATRRRADHLPDSDGQAERDARHPRPFPDAARGRAGADRWRRVRDNLAFEVVETGKDARTPTSVAV